MMLINGSYNSFVQQVGYCKMQGYDTLSRSTSMGPPMFLDGRIKFGVGLSDTQFQGSTSSCGRCINITHIANFFSFNNELTSWDYREQIETPFTVFVMDQCKDAICTSKFLDFDIYNLHQPVAYGNPYSLEWEFVPCPVENDTMEILFCLGTASCNVHDDEHQTHDSLLTNAMESGYWYAHIRNARVPITNVSVSFGDRYPQNVFELDDNNGWLWSHYDYREKLGEDLWTIHMLTEDGRQVVASVDWRHESTRPSTPGYRGGIVVKTNIQV